MTAWLPPIVGLPIKPFGVAKQRLHPRLDAAARSVLGREIAARTAAAAATAGAEVAIVTGDAGVRRWAQRLGHDVIDEGPSRGLDAAATALVGHARNEGRPWVVLHADLPLISPHDVGGLLDAVVAHGAVVAPSHDGGTSAVGGSPAVGGSDPIRFAYGPASFHRHHRQVPTAPVVVRPGLAWDLDTVFDLESMLRLPGGAWVGDLLTAIGSPP